MSRAATSRSPLAFDDSDDDVGSQSNAPQLSALAQALLQGLTADGQDGGSRAASSASRTSGAFATSERLSRASSRRSSRIATQLGSDDERGTSLSRSGSQRQGTTSSRRGSLASAAFSSSVKKVDFVTPAATRSSRRVFGASQTSGSSNSSASKTADARQNSRGEQLASSNSVGSATRHRNGTLGLSSAKPSRTWTRSTPGLSLGPARRVRRESDQQEDDDQDEPSPLDYRDHMLLNEVNGRLDDRSDEARDELMSHSRRSSGVPTLATQGLDNSSPVREVAAISHPRAATPDRATPYKVNASFSTYHTAEAHRNHYANDDKENALPPPDTFRRPGQPASVLSVLAQKSPSKPSSKESLPLADSPLSSMKKPVLAAKSVNTPLRPAPPPPKMTLLKTATAPAGSQTAAAKSKRSLYMTINGEQYRRLEQVGHGGSAKVYAVLAKNNRQLAVKKVSFAECDIAVVVGYKREIELLTKLRETERVIRLLDWEVNDKKGILSLVMEMGEVDLARLLANKYSSASTDHEPELDLSFTRHYWREMLECVHAVHEHNIVHSDLKPANFLLVKARLKLIDFGIAGAIEDDTVNVHRENQVGTVNYMSPEAITDVSGVDPTSRKLSISAPPQARLMKLGTPSDVWSLGCMLYQMIYGRPPFAHLQAVYHRIKAIPDPNHQIEFPPLGIGAVPVPRSAINTLKGCLQRDKNLRPTISAMLGKDDPFLNPDRLRDGVADISAQTLEMLLDNCVNEVVRNGAPSKELVSGWARSVFGKLEVAMRDRAMKAGSGA